jgi:CheY-like chemotaxis protein
MTTAIQILVVEDEPLLRMDIADQLSDQGFHVFEAKDADEAIGPSRRRDHGSSRREHVFLKALFAQPSGIIDARFVEQLGVAAANTEMYETWTSGLR